MDHVENMWDFPVMPGVSFPKANRVHPLMQHRAQKLIQELSKDPNIRRIALFGSSLEFRCSSYSDIDLYLEKHEKGKKLEPLPEVGCEVDIITDLPPESVLYREIDAKGLLLFER